jgi:hypothetical protein
MNIFDKFLNCLSVATRLSTVLQACNSAWSRSPIWEPIFAKEAFVNFLQNMANCRACTTCLFLFLIVTFLNPIENNRKLFLNVINRNFAFYFNKFFNDFSQFDCYFFLLKEDWAIRRLWLLQVLLRSIWCGLHILWFLLEFQHHRDTRYFSR